jgi:hypothetical protein
VAAVQPAGGLPCGDAVVAPRYDEDYDDASSSDTLLSTTIKHRALEAVIDVAEKAKHIAQN